MSDTDIKNGLVIDDFKNKRWYKDDVLHREDDLPAIELNNGAKQWWMNGERHRKDGHAIEYENGDKEWWIGGKRHREDGPAVEYIHNTNAGKHKEWWIDGKRHREDGPAVENSDGTKQWFINRKELSEEQFNHYLEMKKLNEKLHQDLTINNKSNKKLKL